MPRNNVAETSSNKIESQADPKLRISDNFDRDVELVGGELHDEWRISRLKDDGTYEPRIKTTTDEEWIAAHDGTNQVDIANCFYSALPKDWQAENHASAEVALEAVYEIAFYGKGNYGDRDFMTFQQLVDDASSKVHEGWLERNGEWAQEDQKVPFKQLSPEEQEKDRVIVRNKAVLLVKEEMDRDAFLVPQEMVVGWTSEDVQHLLEISSEEAYLKKKGDGANYDSIQRTLNNWGIELGRYKLLGEHKVDLRLVIPYDGATIDGVFGIEDVAKFFRTIRDNTPDIDDSHNFIYSQVRQDAIKKLLGAKKK